MSILQELKIIKFDDSIKKNLINNYFNFSDRSSRADYIWWMIFSVILNLVGSQLDLQLSIIISIIMIPPGTGISIRSCLLYTSPSPRDRTRSRMPSSA